jgi:phage head maturation protease
MWSSLSVRMPAPDGERFAPGAFDAMVGTARLTVTHHTVAWTGVLVEATVEPDGAGAWLTIELNAEKEPTR